MPTTQPEQSHTYRNVMESLVVEEVELQCKHLPTRVANYINKTEVIAYALNRLPPMYATSQQGWQQQRNRASREMHNKIMMAVRQAIAAVQRDPLRVATPLRIEEDRSSQTALQELQELLRSDELSWRNVVDVVEQTLIRTARGEITWRKRGTSSVQAGDWHDNRYFL
ncbi:MAG TPA: late competence development ComFB family protein [Microcoleaceae cyanobacterium]|jgi:hypothetical protein